MYCGSSARLGSLTMPLRLSVLTRYWSITHSRAERLPRRWVRAARTALLCVAPSRSHCSNATQ